MALLFILLVIAGGRDYRSRPACWAAGEPWDLGNHEHLWDWRSVNLF